MAVSAVTGCPFMDTDCLREYFSNRSRRRLHPVVTHAADCYRVHKVLATNALSVYRLLLHRLGSKQRVSFSSQWEVLAIDLEVAIQADQIARLSTVAGVKDEYVLISGIAASSGRPVATTQPQRYTALLPQTLVEDWSK